MEELLMPVYNKLVRDRILEIIQKSGKVAITRKLSQEEYKIELHIRLNYRKSLKKS